ncbi:MAG TPA: hypothetical protein DD979_04660 [Gammaproteobacteria bacterium]|nr:hypothetical protein [Gammaproteobacteria bacterium]
MIRTGLPTFLILCAWALGLFSAPLLADGIRTRVQEADDLRLDARHMVRQRAPMVLEFAAEYCTYCEQIEDEVFEPMILSGDYRETIVLRKISIDGTRLLRDFSGAIVTREDFADRYRVSLTPTVLFLDAEGREIAPRMTGVPLIDFYAQYLDRHIHQARASIAASPPTQPE